MIDALAGLAPAPYLALVVVIAVCVQTLAWWLRVPSILLLLVVGFGVGQLVDPEEVLGRDVLFGGVTLAVGVILFEGSMSLRFRELKEVGRPVFRLCTATVAISWALSTAAAYLLGTDLRVALLIGAILVVTGPTVIAPILRTLRPTRRVSSLLRWEGIVVDPIGAILAVLVYQAVVAGEGNGTWPMLLGTLGLTVLIAVGLTLVVGVLVEQLTARHAIPDHLQGVVFVAAALGTLTASNAIQSESGLLTVTLLGLYLGNRPQLHLNHVAELTEHLQVLLVGALFVVLAGRIGPGELVDVLPEALVFVAILIVVVRPASILLGLYGTDVTGAERSLLARMAPRGIVAAAVTSIFALELSHAAEEAGRDGDPRAADLAALATQAESMVPLVFVVIVCTVAFYGLGVGRLAERLGLASTSPQGVLFVGGQGWVVEAARRLEDSGIPCLVVAREYATLGKARMAGLTTVTTNILSDYAVRDMDLAGIGRLLACTSQDEVNASAAREFMHVLGRANVYQLRRTDLVEGSAGHRRAPAAHLTARTPFEPPLTHDELEERHAAGWRVRATKLTEEFPLSRFKERYDEPVLMFLLRDGKLDLVTEKTRVPESGVQLVALVPADDEVS